ncbi:transposase family protein [Lentzea sp. NPDC006480]|uniref:transposase family protein n=1 Tax=Lentzea sp. NPDC006480 TaxID=3157176 RepID=UPI0033B3A448
MLDGKIFSSDRPAEKAISVTDEQIDLWYSGKAHEHGGNIQALLAPDGFPLWVSDVEPGTMHDLTGPRLVDGLAHMALRLLTKANSSTSMSSAGSSIRSRTV